MCRGEGSHVVTGAPRPPASAPARRGIHGREDRQRPRLANPRQVRAWAPGRRRGRPAAAVRGSPGPRVRPPAIPRPARRPHPHAGGCGRGPPGTGDEGAPKLGRSQRQCTRRRPVDLTLAKQRRAGRRSRPPDPAGAERPIKDQGELSVAEPRLVAKSRLSRVSRGGRRDSLAARDGFLLPAGSK
jgi:hypothetical protein